jgi:signal transduction histidine kinase
MTGRSAGAPRSGRTLSPTRGGGPVTAPPGGDVPRRSRWLLVLVPTAAVVAVEVVLDNALDAAFTFPLNTLVIGAVVFALSAALLFVSFRRIDALTAALRAQNADLAARGARASALHHVSLAIAALGDLDEILDAIVTHARDLLDADVAVLILAGAPAAPGPRAGSGPPGSIVAPPPGWQAGTDPFAFVRADLAASRLAAPLQRGPETIGTLAVASAADRAFTADDVETLSSLAIQAAIAIENTRLQASLREIAVLAERERIAREMHDGLAQVLGYVNTKSQAAMEYLAAGRIADAQVQLDELAAAARSVYVDVRETILALRTPIPQGLGLVAAIEDLGRRFGDASKIAVSVETPDPATVPGVGPEVEAQVFRIVREALTNVRKHAAAHRVRIAVGSVGPDLVVTVTDDGRGIAPDLGAAIGRPGGTTGDWPRYGLESMRERAAAVGGRVSWSAPAGGGTEVRIVVPARRTVASTARTAATASA